MQKFLVPQKIQETSLKYYFKYMMRWMLNVKICICTLHEVTIIVLYIFMRLRVFCHIAPMRWVLCIICAEYFLLFMFNFKTLILFVVREAELA